MLIRSLVGVDSSAVSVRRRSTIAMDVRTPSLGSISALPDELINAMLLHLIDEGDLARLGERRTLNL